MGLQLKINISLDLRILKCAVDSNILVGPPVYIRPQSPQLHTPREPSIYLLLSLSFSLFLCLQISLLFSTLVSPPPPLSLSLSPFLSLSLSLYFSLSQLNWCVIAILHLMYQNCEMQRNEMSRQLSPSTTIHRNLPLIYFTFYKREIYKRAGNNQLLKPTSGSIS